MGDKTDPPSFAPDFAGHAGCGQDILYSTLLSVQRANELRHLTTKVITNRMQEVGAVYYVSITQIAVST